MLYIWDKFSVKNIEIIEKFKPDFCNRGNCGTELVGLYNTVSIEKLYCQLQYCFLQSKECLVKKRKVLIVEDSKMSKHVLQVSAERLGFIPIIASDGQEALQLLEENKDLVIVLSDLKMPNLDGFELLQEVRKQNPFKSSHLLSLL